MPDDPKQPQAESAAPCDLARINLQIGARLQLIARRGGQARNYFATLIGYLDGEAVLVRTPMEHGLPVHFQESDALTVRAFTGVKVYSFDTLVDRVLALPFHTLYLRYPHGVVGTPLRKAIRVKVELPGQATRPAAGESPQTDPVTVTDLSLSGGLIESESELGEVGGELGLSFASIVEPAHSEVRINARAVIRNVKRLKEGRRCAHGVEFVDLAENEEIKLRSVIFDAVVGNRQAVV